MFQSFLSRTYLTNFPQMIYPTEAEGQIRNNGYYDPFPYRFWSYPKDARNRHENYSEGKYLSSNPPESTDSYIADRIIWPRKLCFLDSISQENPDGLLSQEDWKEKDKKPKYLFVSYTGEQFTRRCGSEDKNCKCKLLHHDYIFSIIVG